ncbi:short-chain alcohol dehydrogenase [Streptomyces lincolnensis]|uniref:Short-chain alcohol dehydrogenase n=1 Tax=Streptomyces lincolnensis TaxID=1915 RepID=A0A1B1MC03_STRLN|nr:SDR family oxidoreductase [Streptomyces lincolnensis]ANS66155.1 short-chain alcohol dehydrogenase [Streptomyces lincolnensis]AXG54081.1 short-chain alcohol dehydrogenase [Streptomyces lincolnensis]QMV08460.1 SDR family NAD(P)-dependent oxidoreductase [Streptomyces lincolnensis]
MTTTPASAITPSDTTPSDTTRSKTVLITGASSGIGRATALRLAREGHQVVLGARREDRLAEIAREIETAGGKADVHRLDVTDREDVVAFADAAVERHGRIDVVVNNAGVMPLSRLDALLTDEWDRMIDVNVRGLLHGIAAALPHFQEQGGGHFVTVASIGAHQVVPTAAVYCATKYAAWAVTEGLRLELDPSIRVTTVSPGVVESELADSISDPLARDAMRTYRADSIPPDAIADAISYAIAQPPGVDINELVIRPTRQR